MAAQLAVADALLGRIMQEPEPAALAARCEDTDQRFF